MEEIRLHHVNSAPAILRRKYLDSLPHSQEFFLEQIVKTGDSYEIFEAAAGLQGYIVISGSHIVEIFLEAPSNQLLELVMSEIVAGLNVKKWFIKSFDPLITYINSILMIDSKFIGYLFRQHLDTNFNKNLDLLVTLLDPSEIAEVMAINDGFFEDETEVMNYISQNSLFAYRNIGGELLACGILSRVIEERSAVDIGMLVAAEHRNQGLGAYVASHLKNLCLERGDQPVAGCGAENIPSKKALEAAGFITQYQLLELNF